MIAVWESDISAIFLIICLELPKITSILGHVHIIIRSNNTACLNLLFKLLWNENILNIKKRNLVTNLPLPSSQSSVVYTFHPTTSFQTGVYFNTFG